MTKPEVKLLNSDLLIPLGQYLFQLRHTRATVGAGLECLTDGFGAGEVLCLDGGGDGVDAHRETGADDVADIGLADGRFAEQYAFAFVIGQ